MLLTHHDDVADADRFASHFGARVFIHEDDSRAAQFATDPIRGIAPLSITPRLVAISAPGHTKGSVFFLLEDRYLFSGDSLYWSRRRGRLSAFRDACWYSWEEQARSLSRLVAYSFSWVLPGHGNRHRAEPGTNRNELEELVAHMSEERGSEW